MQNLHSTVNLPRLVYKLKEKHKLDLSSDEDLSIAIMNLVSIEEHFFFTGLKTRKGEYFDLLSKVREMRKELLKKIVKKSEGEVWCISKHLLAASMRLFEVGTKYYSQGEKGEAKSLYAKANELYSLFWKINLGLMDIGQVKKIADKKLNKDDNSNEKITKRLDKLVHDLLDCCDEK